MSETEKFLEDIRQNDGLKNAILSAITVTKRTKETEFTLITDRAYTALDEKRAVESVQKYLPEGFFARVKIVKRVPDEGILKRKIYEFLNKRFPAASAFLTEDDIEIELLQSGAHFYFDIASGDQSLFSSGRILDDVSEYLKTVFCGAFYGDVKIVEKERDESLLDERPIAPETEEPLEIRYFPIDAFKKIDGADTLPTKATYMADWESQSGPYAICGRLDFIEERKYVRHNEKTNADEERSRFSLTLSDGTGNMRMTYFPKKATVEKIRELKIGDSLVVLGENEEYNGSLSFKAGKINLGSRPENYEFEKRKSRPVPKAYHVVFPEKVVDYTQSGFFDDLNKPDDLKNNIFVVFDLETTGLNSQPAMGKMDKIIEIGAVKIIDGKIEEKFTSFVACRERLSQEIVALTGIHDYDLVGAPEIEQVIADFFKFADGAYLVGHNVNFDFNFVKYYGDQNRYAFEHRKFDTLTLAQELLVGKIPNYKLNSVADYYGFTFNHHRAFDDALVTAKCFIELIKTRGKLPN